MSKYIGDEEADLATSVTHKWLIYVTTKTAVPVEQIVSRARFFLHESYKPNEVVEIRYYYDDIILILSLNSWKFGNKNKIQSLNLNSHFSIN